MANYNNRNSRDNRNEVPINGQIRAEEVRLVGEDGAQLGIIPLSEALAKAEEAELDPEFSEKFLRFIIDEVIRHHERLREG